MCRRQDRSTDQVRIFTARIIVGYNNSIRILGGNRTHQRSFSRVAVAASAEHDDQFSFGVWPQGLQVKLLKDSFVYDRLLLRPAKIYPKSFMR